MDKGFQTRISASDAESARSAPKVERNNSKAVNFFVFVLLGIAFLGWMLHLQDASDQKALAEREARDSTTRALRHDREARQNHERRLAWNLAHPEEVVKRKAAAAAKAEAEKLALREQQAADSAASAAAAKTAAQAASYDRYIETPDGGYEEVFPSLESICSFYRSFGASDHSKAELERLEKSEGVELLPNGSKVRVVETRSTSCVRQDEHAKIRSENGLEGWIFADRIR